AGTLGAQRPRTGALARLVFQRGHRLPTVFIGRLASFGRLDEWIAQKEPLGIHPVGLLTDEAVGEGGPNLPAPLLGRVADLPAVLRERQVGQVIVLELPGSDATARGLIDICREHGCRLLIHNNLEERYTQPLVPIVEEGRHFYTLQEEPLEDPLNRIVKRAYDLAIALPVVVLVLPPLCVWVALMQARQAPGPLFHARDRRGL
ncbi:MAG: polyprenyl glycosylphosphotransferase, partial [Verrucomicrobiales bacterium VVV1]